jgi:hypothetical protein
MVVEERTHCPVGSLFGKAISCMVKSSVENDDTKRGHIEPIENMDLT